MNKLLEIYDSYLNGQRKQFMDQVQAYGPNKWLIDIIKDEKNGVITLDERVAMQRTYMAFAYTVTKLRG